MKPRRLLLAATSVLAPLSLAAGIAFATSSGVTPTVHVGGAQLDAGLKVNADRIKFQTKDPADVSVVTLAVEPGGTTGWHSHPGLAVIAVTEGTGTLYFPDCSSKTYGPGEAFVEAGDDPPTVFRNETAEPVLLTVTFVSPRGESFHREEANPGCAVS